MNNKSRETKCKGGSERKRRRAWEFSHAVILHFTRHLFSRQEFQKQWLAGGGEVYCQPTWTQHFHNKLLSWQRNICHIKTRKCPFTTFFMHFFSNLTVFLHNLFTVECLLERSAFDIVKQILFSFCHRFHCSWHTEGPSEITRTFSL